LKFGDVYAGAALIAGLQKMPNEVIANMKIYCKSGQFQRCAESFAGDANIAMFCNTHQPIDVEVQTGHLFALMPEGHLEKSKRQLITA
jgi:ATP-dependent Lon protease